MMEYKLQDSVSEEKLKKSQSNNIVGSAVLKQLQALLLTKAH